jgi:hypothetical protein
MHFLWGLIGCGGRAKRCGGETERKSEQGGECDFLEHRSTFEYAPEFLARLMARGYGPRGRGQLQNLRSTDVTGALPAVNQFRVPSRLGRDGRDCAFSRRL